MVEQRPNLCNNRISSKCCSGIELKNENTLILNGISNIQVHMALVLLKTVLVVLVSSYNVFDSEIIGDLHDLQSKICFFNNDSPTYLHPLVHLHLEILPCALPLFS